jgi:hypothetical protein
MEPSAGLASLFGPESGTLVLTKTGSGTGSIRFQAGDLLCDDACRGVANRGLGPEADTLVAGPSAGSVFGGWLGCDAADGDLCTVSVGTSRRVTASFSRSTLTIEVLGFLDVTVTTASGSATCAGPSRRCSLPVPPGARVEVTAATWPGVPRTDLIAFDGPGCSSTGCSLDEVADPALVSVGVFQLPPAHITYFGGYPTSIRRGETARLLVRTGSCSLSWSLTPEGGLIQEQPGLFRVQPASTTTFEYTCYHRLPGSPVVDEYKKNVTVTVTER